MPNEHKDGDDYGMFFADRKGSRDMIDVDARTWDDMGPGDQTNSFVLEFP
jgi:hypothetical protein